MSTIRQLKAFQAVVLTGTQTSAAEKLRLTQPAVSTLIDALEEELGFPLFDRAKNRLKPTREAMFFYEYASSVLAALDNLGQVAKEIRESNTGTLRIVANPSFSLGFLPRVVAQFRQLHPEVGITLATFSSSKVTELLNSQQYDIGIAESPIPHAHVEIERFRFRCVAMVPEKHRLADRDLLTPTDFEGESFISIHREHPTRVRLTELWAQAKVEPRFDIETQLFWTACLLVGEGCGLTLVDPLTGIEFAGRGLVAIPFKPDVFIEMGIIFPTGRPRSLPALKFAQFVRRHLAEATQASREMFKLDPGPLLEIDEPR